MKIFIHLKNTEQNIQILEESLRHFDGSVAIKEGHLVIVTSSIITGDIDLLDTNNICNVSFKIAEFIDIINGAAIIEGIPLPHISSTAIFYEDPNGKHRTKKGSDLIRRVKISPIDHDLRRRI